jgi:hypothetical protein
MASDTPPDTKMEDISNVTSISNAAAAYRAAMNVKPEPGANGTPEVVETVSLNGRLCSRINISCIANS